MPLRRRLKNFFKQYSDVIVKVREATSNDPWGPSGSMMMEIAEMTYHTDSLSEITQVIGQRLNDSGKNWRHVYKSLVLLDYLMKNGSKQVVLFCYQRAFDIQLLKEFKYLDEAGKDQGAHVRRKSQKIIDLLTDEKSLKLERDKAQHIKLQMLLSMPWRKYKLQPKGPKLENATEKQEARHIDSPSEKISSIQPAQDLMICEDKYQLLYLSHEEQQAAAIPLQLVMSASDPLKSGSRCQSVIVKSEKDTEDTKLQPVQSSVLKSFPIQVHGNTAVDSIKSMTDSKETKPNESCKRNMVTWVDELKKIDYPVSSQPFPSDFTVPRVKSPITLPKQDRIPWTSVSPTPMASLSIPAKAALCPWGNETKNLPVTVRDSVPEPQGSTFSEFPINTGFAFNAPMPNKPTRNYPTSASQKLSCTSSNELNQPTMPTGTLSTVPFQPYHRTNPFISPVMPAVRGHFTEEAAAQSIEGLSNTHRPTWLDLYPTSSFQSSTPIYPSLESGMAAIIPLDMGIQRPRSTSVFSVVPSHPTNPFL